MGGLFLIFKGINLDLSTKQNTKKQKTKLLFICKWLLIDFYPLGSHSLQH